MISVKNITKTYYSGEVATPVLKGIDLDVMSGEFLAIMGKSGAGKSTLMYQMSLLDIPTTGEVHIDNTDVLALNDREKTRFRLEKLGYVFQDYALVPELTARENVMLPLLMLGRDTASAETKADEMLTAVGLEHRFTNRPSQLSGGEQQRVSIARAIVQEPKILFADEPTANLDSVSSRKVLDVLERLHQHEGQTIVMVTHEREYADNCNRIIHLEDGVIVDEERIQSLNKQEKNNGTL